MSVCGTRASADAMTPGSIRLYVAADLAPNSAITLSADQAGYLGRVMRRGPGDPVHLFNAAHGEWAARIETLRRDQATLRVETRTRPPSPEPDIHLVFAPLRRDATEWVVQKATELGVAALLPVLTTRSVALRINPDRLRAIATEAAEQCERLSVPVIHPLQRLDPLLASWPPDRRLDRRPGTHVRPAGGPRHRPRRPPHRPGRRLHHGRT